MVRNPYLQHHGTKGMKWGVRRYQNKDGSLTPVGKKHNKESYTTTTKNGETLTIERNTGGGGWEKLLV